MWKATFAKIDYGRFALEYLRNNKEFITTRNGLEEISGAAILLFGKNPQRFFQRTRVRFIRYEGTETKVGTEMNVVKDVLFNGKILDMVRKSTEFVKGQIKGLSFLGQNGHFVTIPEFCWTELIVNAIGHRDYSIAGTDIQIKMFDDHLTVENPGMLHGLVRTNNIRKIHFSWNPKIFEFLHEYEYIKEFGEGVDRMFREMETAGLPNPEYRTVEFMVYATIKNQKWVENHKNSQDTATSAQVAGQVDKCAVKKQQLLDFCSIPRSRKEIQMHLGLTGRNHFNDTYLKPLLAEGKLKMTIPDKPNIRNQKYIKV